MSLGQIVEALQTEDLQKLLRRPIQQWPAQRLISLDMNHLQTVWILLIFGFRLYHGAAATRARALTRCICGPIEPLHIAMLGHKRKYFQREISFHFNNVSH